MSWILYFIYLLIFVWVIQKASFFNSPGIERKWLVFIFLTKIVGGIALFCIYNFYYTPRSACDLFNYFDDGLIIHNILYQNPIHYLKIISGIGAQSPEFYEYYDTCNFWLKAFNYGLPNDNRIIIRIHAILCLISMGNFHIHNMIFGFLGFIGLWAIYKSFAKQLANKRVLLLIFIFFFPSVWLWTSGATKESVLIFAFGFFIYNFRNMIVKANLYNIIGVIFCTSILMISKFYVLMCAIPSLTALWWIQKKPKLAFIKFICTHFGIFVVAYLSKFITNIDLFDVICNKQHDFIMMSKSMIVGSFIDLPLLNEGLKSIIINTPQAIATTLFRPSIFEEGSVTMLFASIENILIILLFIVSLLFINIKLLSTREMWFCLSFVLILFALIGMTTPVMGALVRYKAPALPFIGIALLLITSNERVGNINKQLETFLKGKRNKKRDSKESLI